MTIDSGEHIGHSVPDNQEPGTELPALPMDNMGNLDVDRIISSLARTATNNGIFCELPHQSDQEDQETIPETIDEQVERINFAKLVHDLRLELYRLFGDEVHAIEEQPRRIGVVMKETIGQLSKLPYLTFQVGEGLPDILKKLKNVIITPTGDVYGNAFMDTMRADQTKRSANEKKLASITSFHAVIGKSKEEVNELTHSLSNNPTKLDLEQMSALIGYLQRLVYQEGKTTTVESNSSGYYANATLWDTVLGLLRSEVQGGLGSHRELLKPPQESTEE